MNQAILNRARNDKFRMVLDLPPALKETIDPVLKAHFDINKFQFTCYGSPVPSISIPPIDVPFGGQYYKASSNHRPSYPPIHINFLIDNGWKNYWMISRWINLFNEEKYGDPSYNFAPPVDSSSVVVNRNSIPMKQLVANITTFALDEFNNNIISFEYAHAFPIGLSEIKFSHQDPSEISCVATFEYFQFYPKLLKNVDDATCSYVQ